jgi:outer membrane protein TolC
MNHGTASRPARTGLALLALALVAAPLRAQRDDTLPTLRPAPDSTLTLTLAQAVRVAASGSPVAETGRLRAEQALARVRQSRAALLPDITGEGTRTERTFNTAEFGVPFPGFDPSGTVLGPVHLWDFRARAQANLINLSAIERLRAARRAAEASNAEATASSEQAANTAAQAYLRAQRAQATFSALAADSALASDLLGIAEEQLRAGVGIALDVTRAQSQVANIRAQLIAARAERDRSAFDLVRALGLPVDTRIAIADSVGGDVPDELAGTSEADAVQRALAARPDLVAANRQLRAAREQVTAIRAEYLPSLGIYGNQGFIGNTIGNLKNTYAWGLQLSVPIFEGFGREGRLQEQQAATRIADVRRRDLTEQVTIEVRSARMDLGAAREQVAAARERLRLAEQEVEQARDRFRAGVAGNADVITASLALTGARTQAIDAETQLEAARVALARAEGSVRDLR